MSFDVSGKICTVIGAARSGIAAANLLISLGAIVKISDSKPLAELETQLKELKQQQLVTIEAHGHTESFIKQSDLIIVSPGVPYSAKPLLWAREANIETISEIELAFRLCPAPIVAVTGTNGKTTTVNLIHDILKHAGRSVVLCGNIGQAFSSKVMDVKKSDIVVLEISSFQLQTTVSFRPKVAVWTNFSQNHLDQHRDLKEYFEAKCRLVVNQQAQDVTILNAKQPEHVELAKSLQSRVVFFNSKEDPRDIDNPNFLAALYATRALGVDESLAREVFTNFKGVEHRMEFVRNLDGVLFINDSKSTTLEAGRWALERVNQPTVLICGGSSKNLDYEPIKDLVANKVKHVIAIGEIRQQMYDTFKSVVGVVIADDFKEAIHLAHQSAKRGDIVLLSPMTASFDMFNDYEHRGRVFKEMVNAL